MQRIGQIYSRGNSRELKEAYAKRLFKKYGFNRGALFENIPVRYKLHPLWSPSAYAACEGEQIAQWLMEGMEEGIKNPIKIDWVKIMEGNENGNT